MTNTTDLGLFQHIPDWYLAILLSIIGISALYMIATNYRRVLDEVPVALGQVGFQKRVLEWVAWAAFGLWAGINYTGGLAYPAEPTVANTAWTAAAKNTAWGALLGVGVCVFAWIFIDAREKDWGPFKVDRQDSKEGRSG